MPGPSVLVQRRGRVTTITLNRPEASNTIDAGLASALTDACAALADDDDVRAVVLTGAGEAFATGLPSSVEASGGSTGAASAVAGLRVPTVAWVNGDCLDQGLELALACDVRVAAPGARFGIRHVQEGLLPRDGGTQRLVRLVGRGGALRLLLTGAVIPADEALGLGLVQTVAGSEAVDELTERVAAAAPIAAAYTKEAVLRGADMALEEGLRLEADLAILLHTTADRAEGLRSFAERRRPNYQGR